MSVTPIAGPPVLATPDRLPHADRPRARRWWLVLGNWIGDQIAVGKDYLTGTDQNDVAIYMGYLFAVIGWLVGLGFANYPIGRLLGRPPPCVITRPDAGALLPALHRPQGRRHPVPLRGRLFFFIGGLNAMLIRTELLRPVAPS